MVLCGVSRSYLSTGIHINSFVFFSLPKNRDWTSFLTSTMAEKKPKHELGHNKIDVVKLPASFQKITNDN
jgi:hypothetical protein